MRIVGGTLKGRRFEPPIKNWKTRPTTDYAKEALFNILENEFDLTTIRAIDLFAGTGNITFELLSRGCLDVTAVERFYPAVNFIKKMAVEWKLNDRLSIVQKDVKRFIEKANITAELIFADPPYDMGWIGDLPELIFSSALSKDMRMLVIEHDLTTDFSEIPYWHSTRKYGQSRFSFFRSIVD